MARIPEWLGHTNPVPGTNGTVRIGLRTATDRLASPADNRVEILRDDARHAVRVRYIESGTVSTIHSSHVTDRCGYPLWVRFGTGPHNYKWRDVGYYDTVEQAHAAVRDRTYGF